jgi:hypothetical protein
VREAVVPRSAVHDAAVPHAAVRSRGERWPRGSTVLGAAFVVWGVAIGLVRLHDNSFLTHVATGRLILAHGVPTTDPYTFTAHGHPWVVESWLASLLYALVERADGGHGLQLLHAALGGALGAVAWTLTRPARQLPGRIVAAAALLAVGTGYWSPRPLLIALALFGALVVLVETDSPRVWLAVPLMWVWVNVHGSWPFGLAYLVLRLLGRHADGNPLGRLPRLTMCCGAGTMSGAFNPIGIRLLSYPAVVLTHHAAFAHIAEWQSPSFADTVNAVFLAQVLIAVVLLVVRRGTIEDALPAAAFTAVALLAARNVPVAALVVTPVLARGVAGLGTVTGTGKGPVPALALTAMAALGAVLVSQALSRPAYDLSAYPVSEVTWLQRHHLAPGRVIAPDYVGNYLEFRFGARASVFVDDRVDVLAGTVEHDYGVLLSGSPGWQAVLARYRAQAVLWPRSEPLSALLALAPGWTEPVKGRNWVVAVPVRPAGRRA